MFKSLPISTIVIGVAMGLAFIGMLYCAKKQRENPNMQLFAIALLVAIIGLGVSLLFQTGVLGEGEQGRLMANELKYSKAKALIFGKALAAKYPKANAMLIIRNGYDKNEREKSVLESLKEGLGKDINISAIVSPELPKMNPMMMKDGKMPPDAQMMMMPMDDMIGAEAFDKMMGSHKACDLVISMISLPFDFANMKFWKTPASEHQKLALLESDPYMLKDGIKKGYIVAMVAYKPNIKFTEDPAPKEPQKAFDERFMVITPENLASVEKEFPNFFKPL